MPARPQKESVAVRTVHIPQLNRDVSSLCMGTMIYSSAPRDFTFQMLDAFVDAGGNILDTAEVYRSEPVIADWMEARGNRKEVVVLDKALDAVSKVTPEAVHTAIDGNLSRIRSDYIDLWMLHRDNPAIPVGELVDALNEEVRRGRILAFGGSNWTPKRLAEANAYAAKHGLKGMAGSSPNLSLATAKEPFWSDCAWVSEDDRKWYEESQLPVFSWSSQARGFFSGRFRPDDTSNSDMVRVYYSDANFERLRRAEELAAKKGVRAIEIALAWVLHQRFPTVALIGPANLDELNSCLVGEGLRLTADEIAWLEEPKSV
jgi:aryl-alcohol dehydrogenase-like predicted oxidoreductase